MSKLDFAHLSETKFEEFVFHLITRLGFVNVDWRKGTGHNSSPSDSGRDIVCQELREDVDKSKHLETWFVDCKHYKKGVPPADIQNLLTWAEAESPNTALIVTSGFLSNPAKEYLEKYRRNRKPPFRIKHWERPQLEQMAARKYSLLAEHDLLPVKTRTIKEILEAEDEFFDAIWYDRNSLLLRQFKEEQKSETKKMMVAAMRRVEAKRGKQKLRSYYKNDFEWGMLNGKLSALRWILGEEWDMLDT